MKFFNSSALPLLIGGLLAGFANGLLGAGGGIIIVYLLSNKKILGDKVECDSRDVFANALCVMLPLSVVSCVIYALRGDIVLGGFEPFILPAIIGGVLGGILLCFINTSFPKKLFAALVVISGILLIIK